MGKIIITFKSVTYAIKAKKLLLKSGTEAKLVKISKDALSGCTHGVEISEGLFLNAIGILRNSGIEYSVYHP